ncbi:polyribonucleotide nucleotidyltransferase [Ornithinimicrobium cerasi]|uniref:polyribonucleotide nucleotidyltransferase n=1 Tax=Ornithinimicrobium cerasi TaxID=2248773 RepID=UPI000EFF7DAF|nr:polyribonucleotide nucleotidyltransferase [Ornithinimicrobium cerasi]
MEGPEITFAEATIDNGSFGTRTVRFETGRLARQAGGSVTAYLDDDTMLLSTTTASKHPKDFLDFFPLTVDVEERMYAAGKIPGSFFRREGRPSTDAILTCRLIDRPLRPTFAKGLRNEVQVVITVLSLNPDHQYDVLAINAASASTQISGLPFSGPIGATRVSLIDGQWVAFPNFSDAARSTFDMVVAGRVVDGDDGQSDVAIMMVEAESTDATWTLVKDEGKQAPTEDVVAQGLEESKKFIKALCEAQAQLASGAAKEVQEFRRFLDYEDDAYAAVQEATSADLEQALQIAGKQERESRIDEIKVALKGKLLGLHWDSAGDSDVTEDAPFAGRDKEIDAAYRAVQKKLIRERILRDQVRIDGRGLRDIRALSAEVEVIPRAHGSAIFERGETQIMGVTTLNMLRMEQQVDTLSPVSRKRYMHNYNFPPYSTGETGRVGSPKRREIGHGALAERALMPVLPTREEFPYAIRQVSEALGSNGSTSMGSVCASTMSLLNAGVPLRAPVAGIAMGLVSAEIENDAGQTETKYAALTDILGAEDAFGDMDFKVAGTREFITAIQLDTKLDGLPADVLGGALTQAREARMHILDVMTEAIDAPDEMSPFAPRVITVKVPIDKIGEVIGPKGKMINQIQEDTGADISIEDDGTVYIGATDGPSAEAARAAVNAIANPTMPEIGERFMGTVVKTTTFGAFISLLPGKDGLLHISEIRKLVGGRRIDAVEDVLSVGQKVQVELKEIDPRGKLSLGAVAEGDGGAQAEADVPTAPETAAPVTEPVAAPEVADVGSPVAAAAAEAPQLPGVDTSAPVADEAAPAADEPVDGEENGEGGDRPRRQRRRRGGRGRGGSTGQGAEGDSEESSPEE